MRPSDLFQYGSTGWRSLRETDNRRNPEWTAYGRCSTGPRRKTAIVKGFRMPARHRRVGVHGGRRPKSLEGGNRGGSSRRRWCRSMGNLSPLVDLICGFRTGRRLSDQAGAGFGRSGWDWCGDLVFGAAGLSAEGGAEGRCGRSVGAAGEIATPGGSGDGGWREVV